MVAPRERGAPEPARGSFPVALGCGLALTGAGLQVVVLQVTTDTAILRLACVIAVTGALVAFLYGATGRVCVVLAAVAVVCVANTVTVQDEADDRQSRPTPPGNQLPLSSSGVAVRPPLVSGAVRIGLPARCPRSPSAACLRGAGSQSG